VEKRINNDAGSNPVLTATKLIVGLRFKSEMPSLKREGNFNH
jgi:hypothetical protein